MRTLKQLQAVLFGLWAFYALLLFTGCGSPNPNSSNSSNPLITFKVPNVAGFGVTPDTIAQASSVLIEVSGQSGSPDTSFLGQPGVRTIIDLDTSFHRPLQLRLIYKTAAGEVLLEDQFRIDDSQMKGVVIPDMDVVIGVTSFPTCPGASTSVNVSTNSGVTTFPWSAGDAFEVVIGYNGNTYKFRLHPEDGISGGAGKLTLYERPSQLCLSDINTQVISSKEIEITSVASNCTIRGWEDGTTRSITIKHPTTATIVVHK